MTMAFIDLRFYRSKKTVAKKTKAKVMAKDSDPLLDVVRKGVKKLLTNQQKEATEYDVDTAIKRIERITTNTTDQGADNLTEWLNETRKGERPLRFDSSSVAQD